MQIGIQNGWIQFWIQDSQFNGFFGGGLVNDQRNETMARLHGLHQHILLRRGKAKRNS